MIGKIIVEMRKAGGFSQVELAHQLGIAQATLSGYETNSSRPSFETVHKIACICEFDIVFVDRNNGETKQL